MRKTVQVITCDICGKDITGKAHALTVPVIFHTDQTEGRGCDPYIDVKELDLCPDCVMKVTNVHAHGAQGFNDYELRMQRGES